MVEEGLLDSGLPLTPPLPPPICPPFIRPCGGRQPSGADIRLTERGAARMKEEDKEEQREDNDGEREGGTIWKKGVQPGGDNPQTSGSARVCESRTRTGSEHL